MNLAATKIIAMISLGVGSFLTGILPIWLSPISRRRCPLFLSCLLCWGGGVLLATALLHMLPEARETFPQYAELSFCGGFFLVYLVDELVHFLCGDKIESKSMTPDNGREEENSSSCHHGHSHQPRQGTSKSYGTCESSDLLRVKEERQPLGGKGRDTQHSCLVSHDEPCMRSTAGTVGLLIALLLHSVLEGFAIGLQNDGSKVLLLVVAVASHKLVVGFCLGVELSAVGRRNICSHLLAIMLFSLGSVLGIGLGMFIELSNEIKTESTLGILQSLAAGTLLYVTVSEVLPRERAKWHRSKRHAGLVQLLATIFGFILMFLMTMFLGE